MENTTVDEGEAPRLMHHALLAIGRPPSWRQLGEGWKSVNDNLKAWGVLATIPLGFAGAGFVALLAMADGLATSPLDLASSQDLVWLGMRMPALAVLLTMTLWIALALVGWTRTLLDAVNAAVEASVSTGGSRLWRAVRKSLAQWYLFVAGFLPYLAVGMAFVDWFVQPLLDVAKREAKSAFDARPTLVRMVGTDRFESAKLRGRLGDYYVFVDDRGPKLVARSQVLELRAPERAPK